MTDICAPHPWVKAQNRPSNGEKIKSIQLLSTLCNSFAHRYFPDKHTKYTRTKSVIYLRQTTEHSNENYPKTTHHNVFLNPGKRDLRPNASPEEAGRTPLKGNEWRLQDGTLGAAMWLKASSQATPEITRHPKKTQATEKLPKTNTNQFPPK